MLIRADNAGTVALNGTQFGAQTAEPVSNYTTGSTFGDSTPEHFLVGLNALTITNVNGPSGGPEGIDFKATITYTPGPSLTNLVRNGGFEFGTVPSTGVIPIFAINAIHEEPL